MNILLLSLPVHVPTVMPYSLAKMNSILCTRIDEKITAIDLNAKYHRQFFSGLYELKKEDFFLALEKFMNETRLAYQKISKDSLNSKVPEGHDFLMGKILEKKPDIIAISFIYNSQAFFAKTIIADLERHKIPVIIGGPGDFSKVYGNAKILPNYESLVTYLENQGAKPKKDKGSPILDFGIYEKEDYFTKDLIYPLRTSISCPYKLCAFCTHHGNLPYEELSLPEVRDAIIKNKMKKVFFTDDDFPIERLKELAQMLLPLNISWWCQLRPLKKVIPLMPLLKESGLVSIGWGIESGSQKILDLIQKGTKIADIEEVLKASTALGIKNMAYLMFGYPGETKEDAEETIDLIKRNKENIALISPTTFGLQQGSRIFADPDKFGVEQVTLKERTFLSDKVFYIPKTGMTQEEADKFRLRHVKELRKLNKMPNVINQCKEQVLNI